MNTENRMLHQLMHVGELLLISGAEIRRVEETISRMGKAYGAKETDVFVITSSIVVTMTFPDGEMLTQTRRIRTSGGTDFRKIEDLNALSRRCCEEPLTVEELRAEVHRIRDGGQNSFYLLCGSILAAGGLTVFFWRKCNGRAHGSNRRGMHLRHAEMAGAALYEYCDF